MISPTEDELSAAVAAAIQEWKRTRQLPYLSPDACSMLNQLIVASFHAVLAQRAQPSDRSSAAS
jgi:hypothetical protein